MLSNDGYFIIQHDNSFIALALATSLLAALTTAILAEHARSATGRGRPVWLAVAALAGGIGIWATHFFAMLGFVTGLSSGYDVTLMVCALLLAVLSTGYGFAITRGALSRRRALAGGVVVGIGIAAMQAGGMASYQVAGELEWNRAAVALAVVLGISLSAAALDVGRGRRVRDRIASALLLAAAICSHHFIALHAVSIGLAPGVTIAPDALPPQLLILPVGIASALILLLAAAALTADIRSRRRAAAEADRMRSLADAAVEGLLICDGGTVVTCNSSLAALTGFASSEIAGLPVSRFLRDASAASILFSHPDRALETDLTTRDGDSLPVELILHHIQFVGKTHQAVAVRDLRARKLAEERIRFLAHNDVLTGLPNRAMFEARLDDAVAAAGRRKRGLAVMCLDLDRFKEINDLFGHHAGDETLKAVGRALATLSRGLPMAARLGGDEFAVILPDLADAEPPRLVAAEILLALSALNGERISGPAIAASIGIALFPADGQDREALLGAADTALYRAKAEGRGTYRFYEAGMGAEVRERRRIEHDLRSAIGRGEMSLVFQPQMTVHDGTLVGFEALLRWDHPERGPVSPSLFIPIAEDSGSILTIGEWVLRTACKEASGWTAPLRIAVNVSAVQLHAPGFATLVETILMETGIDPRRLEIEVTETALIRDITRALAALRRLKDLGIKIAMDDFGTGYSSLSNLRAFPFDRIKIDGSFIQSVDSNHQAAAIVRAILELGRGLDLSILAEGVETAAELDFLGSELCHEVQGYLLGRPAPIEHFAAATSGAAGPGSSKDASIAA